REGNASEDGRYRGGRIAAGRSDAHFPGPSCRITTASIVLKMSRPNAGGPHGGEHDRIISRSDGPRPPHRLARGMDGGPQGAAAQGEGADAPARPTECRTAGDALGEDREGV